MKKKSKFMKKIERKVEEAENDMSMKRGTVKETKEEPKIKEEPTIQEIINPEPPKEEPKVESKIEVIGINGEPFKKYRWLGLGTLNLWNPNSKTKETERIRIKSGEVFEAMESMLPKHKTARDNIKEIG